MKNNRLSISLLHGPHDGASVVVELPGDVDNAMIVVKVRGAFYAGRFRFANFLEFHVYSAPAAGVFVELITTTILDAEAA